MVACTALVPRSKALMAVELTTLRTSYGWKRLQE